MSYIKCYEDGSHCDLGCVQQWVELVQRWDCCVDFDGAQRFRTPRGLEEIKRRFAWDEGNSTLYVLTEVFQSYATMWTEGLGDRACNAEPDEVPHD